MSVGNVLKSWLVASDELTTNAHGNSEAAKSIAISVSSLSGSLLLPVPALG